MKKNNYVIPFEPKDVESRNYILKGLGNLNRKILSDIFTKTLFVSPLEIHKNSVVIKGFNTESYKNYTPRIIEFRDKQHKNRRTNIIDTMITPEIAILYVDNDIRKWPYHNGIIIYLETDLYKYYALS